MDGKSEPGERFPPWERGPLDVRTLVYAEIAWLGPKVILTEFGSGILACGGLGLIALIGGGWFALVGAWLLCISLNFVPLLAQAIRLTRQPGGPPDRSALAAWSPAKFGRLPDEARVTRSCVPFAVVLLYFFQRVD